MVSTCTEGIEDVVPALFQCGDVPLLGLVDVLHGDSCSALAASLSDLVDAYGGPSSSTTTDVSCFANVIVVEKTECAAIATVINAMVESYRYEAHFVMK
jgi:hypothetical protein